MDAELRAAAEDRVRRALAALAECLRPNDNAEGEWAAEPADGGEAVTEDRLRKIGLPPRPGFGVPITSALSLWNSSKGWGLYFHGGEGDSIAGEDNTDRYRLAGTPTMGHVYRLLAALGVPAGEGK